jgi:hypothetical protein
MVSQMWDMPLAPCSHREVWWREGEALTTCTRSTYNIQSSSIKADFIPELELVRLSNPPSHECMLVKNAQLGVYTQRSWALRDRAGSRRKGLGFSLCAVPSQLAGPCITGVGGRVESRRRSGQRAESK